MLLFDGKTTTIDNQPVVPENMELVPHNVLAAHMFKVLTGCQAMQRFQINPTKSKTIHLLLKKKFPAINSSDNKPTY